jgi:hypothetical protein
LAVAIVPIFFVKIMTFFEKHKKHEDGEDSEGGQIGGADAGATATATDKPVASPGT